MKKIKGFTLVELLGVIVILSILMVILIPLVNKSSTNAKIKTYETKLKLIENAAVMYGQDNYKSIVDSGGTRTIRVKDLIPDYYTADNETSSKKVNDPRDSKKFLDDYTIKINIDTSTRKVTATIQG